MFTCLFDTCSGAKLQPKWVTLCLGDVRCQHRAENAVSRMPWSEMFLWAGSSLCNAASLAPYKTTGRLYRINGLAYPSLPPLSLFFTGVIFARFQLRGEQIVHVAWRTETSAAEGTPPAMSPRCAPQDGFLSWGCTLSKKIERKKESTAIWVGMEIFGNLFLSRVQGICVKRILNKSVSYRKSQSQRNTNPIPSQRNSDQSLPFSEKFWLIFLKHKKILINSVSSQRNSN